MISCLSLRLPLAILLALGPCLSLSAEKKDERSLDSTVPAQFPGTGSYPYLPRHEAILKLTKEGYNPDLVMIGDSIVHHWGGLPNDRLKNGEKILKSELADYRILNLGFGHDRTQNALWRIQNGELNGISPKWVLINIGSNNTSDKRTSTEIMQGIRLVCEEVQTRVPTSKIILMSILPRELRPTHSRRVQIEEINRMITRYAAEKKFIHLDLTKEFLDDKNEVRRDLMPDTCHPNADGYMVWAKGLLPVLKGARLGLND
jgi:lysophospholipase L1-like esterase